jgi:viroplasmin and RNaseH domain-containing protein
MGYHKGSICIDDLFAASKAGHSSVKTGNNGKKYAQVIIWTNDTADKFGKVGSIQLSQPKDSNETKVYIGSLDAPKEAPKAEVDILADTNGELPF